LYEVEVARSVIVKTYAERRSHDFVERIEPEVVGIAARPEVRRAFFDSTAHLIRSKRYRAFRTK